MRIVGGKLANRNLTSPGGRVRPTAEEVRSAWVNELRAHLDGARVLDLFAGTGALGFEAISNGATSCDFIENGSSALHSLKANRASLGLRDSTRIFKRDALAFASAVRGQEYDIAFADPPYRSGQLDRLVEIWLKNPFAARLSVEHASDHRLPGRAKRKNFGATVVSFYESRK